MLLLFAGETRLETAMKIAEYLQLTEDRMRKIHATRMIIKVCDFQSDEAFLKFIEELKLEECGYND